MPIITFDSLDAVPEGLRDVAKQEGEKVTINVVATSRLEEFRDKNIELLKERDELKQRVETLAPIVGDDTSAFESELQELRLTAQRVKDGTLTEGRKVEEEVARRSEEMRKSLEDQIRVAQKETSLWKQKAESFDATLKRTTVQSAIKDAALDSTLGVLPQALPDILSRATNVWRATDDGKVVAYQGDLQLYGADGGSLQPKEWLTKLREDAPHFFKGTHGGGAGGEPARGAHGKTAQEMKGMTAEQKLALSNGEKGYRL